MDGDGGRWTAEEYLSRAAPRRQFTCLVRFAAAAVPLLL